MHYKNKKPISQTALLIFLFSESTHGSTFKLFCMNKLTDLSMLCVLLQYDVAAVKWPTWSEFKPSTNKSFLASENFYMFSKSFNLKKTVNWWKWILKICRFSCLKFGACLSDFPSSLKICFFSTLCETLRTRSFRFLKKLETIENKCYFEMNLSPLFRFQLEKHVVLNSIWFRLKLCLSFSSPRTLFVFTAVFCFENLQCQ